MDDGELPKFVLEVLLMGPKQLARDNFNEVHFLRDVDKLVLDCARALGILSFEKSFAKRYAKIVRRTQINKGVKKEKII